MSVTAPACASCVLGATSTALLSFTYHALETITVSVIPHITVYTQGSSTSRTTNYVSITETATDYIGGGSNRNASKTFTDANELTWMVGDATLTFPTTYVQYLGFAGAPVASDEKCANGGDATGLELPSSTDAASFIYPLTSADAGATSLPEPLLQYLQGQAPFAAQFSGQALTGCAGLDYIPPETSSSVSVSSITISNTPLSSVPTYSGPSSSWRNASFTATIATSETTATSTERAGTPTRQTPGLPLPSTPGAASGSSIAAPPPPQYSVPVATTNSHSTAFVIQPITAPKPIVTTLPAPGGNDKPKDTTTTKPHGNHSPNGYPSSTGDGSGPTVPPAQITQSDHDQQGPGKPHSVYTVGSSKITANPKGAVPIGHQTLHRGETVTLGHGSSATTVALEGHGKHERLVVNGETQKGHVEYQAITGAPALASSGVITFQNGHKVTAIYSGGSVVLQDGASKTIVAAGSKVTFDGQTVQVPKHGSAVTVNGAKVPLTEVLSSQAIIAAGENTITAADCGSYVVFKEGSKTIVVKDGYQTKFEGHTISVGPSGSAVVVDGKTVTLSAAPTPEAIITAGGHTITALDMPGSVILEDGSSSTIAVNDGRNVVFDGQSFKIPAHGSALVVNGRTVSFTTTTSATTGVAGYINSGLGGGGTPSPTSTVQPAGTNAAASAGLTAVAVRWSALLAALGLLLVI